MNKIILVISITLITACSTVGSLVKADDPVVNKPIYLTERQSFLPESYKELVDSNTIESDFLEKKLVPHFLDTIPDSGLYDKNAPVFPVIPLDTGFLVCEKDMATFITNKKEVKYYRTEIEARKKIQLELLRGTVQAENLYKSSIEDLNDQNKKLYDAYREERADKKTWKNITMFMVAFTGGFALSQYVVSR
jgi:hypothetical protein